MPGAFMNFVAFQQPLRTTRVKEAFEGLHCSLPLSICRKFVDKPPASGDRYCRKIPAKFFAKLSDRCGFAVGEENVLDLRRGLQDGRERFAPPFAEGKDLRFARESALYEKRFHFRERNTLPFNLDDSVCTAEERKPRVVQANAVRSVVPAFMVKVAPGEREESFSFREHAAVLETHARGDSRNGFPGRRRNCPVTFERPPAPGDAARFGGA